MAYKDRQLTFDDLRGLRAEGYIRDSTLDQKDGFGPAIQRGNEERFAETYGLILGNRWYTEFSSGRSVETVPYPHLRAHETRHDLVCRLPLEKKKSSQ